MSEQQRLRDLLRPGLEAVIKPATQRRIAAISSAFDNAGNLKPEAAGTAFTFTATLYLPGAVTVGVDRSATLPVMGQRGRLRTLYARAGTAPSGGECTVWLTANGADVAAVTLQPGETKRATPVGAAVIVDAGADLQARVSAANGAADITITAVLSPVGS